MSKSFTLLPWQSSLFTAFKKVFNEPHSQNLVVLARRQVCHKSASGLACMLYALTHSEYKTFLWFAPTYKQAKRQFTELLKWSRIFDLHCTLNFNKSEFTIVCEDTGSSLQFFSLSEPDNVRGETADGVVVDEAAFIDDEALSIIFPMTDVNKAWILWLSTPWQKSGLFYQMFTDKASIIQDWTRYDLNEYCDQERIDFYRRTLSPSLFKTEILGQFLDDGESLLYGNITDSLENEPEWNETPLYVGIDPSAAQNDYTSVVAFFKDGDVFHELFTHRFRNSEISNNLVSLMEVLKPYDGHIARIAFETNGVGFAMFQQFRDLLQSNGLTRIALALHEDNWSATSKNEAVTNSVVLFGAGKVRMHSAILISECQSYTEFVNPKTGKVSYGNAHQENREYHDDCWCAALHALSSIHQKNRKRQYLLK